MMTISGRNVKKEEACRKIEDNGSVLEIDTQSEVMKKLRIIRTLKHQNRIREQQDKVVELKKHGSYRTLKALTGIPLKTLHDWCAEPKERNHKGTTRSQMKKDEFLNLLMQDTITYSHPCKHYAGKKFLLHTWDEVYKRYINQPEFHRHGIISKTSMRIYKPKYILLAGSTPVNQCLCDICENCDLIL